MIKIADLPAVRAQLEQDAAGSKKVPASGAKAAPAEYARAPDGDGHAAALRPQGGQR